MVEVLFPPLPLVSTHSRPKAAAKSNLLVGYPQTVSTHSRPKAAAIDVIVYGGNDEVSTHSRPKAAARLDYQALQWATGFNTQPPEGGCYNKATA